MGTMTVADVMTAPSLVAVEEETLRGAASRMEQRGVGSVVVVEAGRPIGILTERDLLRAMAAGTDPATSTVGAWMTRDPECLAADATIDDAWRQLGQRGYRHIPVVAGGDFKGTVSRRNLVALAQLRPAAESAMVAPPGLKGVVVAETAVGDVRGIEGFFHYRQYSAPDLAAARSYEDVWHLMFEGELPTSAEREDFGAEIAANRHVPSEVLDVVATMAPAGIPMATLRTALSHLAAAARLPASLDVPPDVLRAQAMQLSAALPTLTAAIHRIRSGHAALAPRDDLGHAANYLYMLTGEVPDPERVRAVEQYFILAMDHGFNASSFTARALTSTGADLGAAIVAAIGSLSGPLHGGAIDRSLETLDALRTPARADVWVREAVLAGRTIMGFGHPVYKTADPRSTMLRAVALRLAGDRGALAAEVEAAVERCLEELKPGRELHTNIEWYASVVLESCGIPRDIMPPTFACTRVVGWCVQAMEQAADNRIIRPSAHYIGPPAPQQVPTV